MASKADRSRRAGRWAGRHAREQQWEYLVRIWRPVVALELVVLVGANGMTLAFPTMAMSFVAGVIVTVGLLLPAYAVAQQSGTVQTMAGADAERFTSDDLKRLRRRGWVAVDHIPFADGDIDHALVSSSAAYAIETKWSATPWLADDERISRYCGQADRASGKLRRLLRGPTVGLDVPANPVLVLQGGASEDFGEPSTMHGVLVMRGRCVKRWADGLGTADRDVSLRTAEANLDNYLSGRDRWIREHDEAASWFVRRGIFEPLRTVFVAFATFLVGIYVSALVLSIRPLPVALRIICVCIAASVGPLATRTRWLRPIGWAWTAGCLAVLALLGVLTASVAL